MKKNLTIFILFISSFTLAQDITGIWEGLFYTERTGKRGYYYFRFYLKQFGSSVWGVCEAMSYVDNEKKFEINKAEVLCKYPVSGELPRKTPNQIFQLYRGNIIEARTPLDICESVNFIEFNYKIINNTEYLMGKWYSIYPVTVRNDGAGGELAIRKVSRESPDFVDTYFPKLEKMLTKTFKKDSAYLVKAGVYDKIFQPQPVGITELDSLMNQGIPAVKISDTIQLDNRLNIIQKTIVLDSLFVQIDLYDNGVVDDDTVSVYLNGSKIVNSRRLTGIPLHMELELDNMDENEMKLVAENLGAIPPNTALMTITVDGKRTDIILSASFSNNAVVIFKRSKKPS
jgi:hypothetical protein